MDRLELQKEKEMSYDELTKYLQNKYGIPNRAYFRTETCKSKSPITRGNEGLFIHHIKETEMDDLSQSNRAPNYPWEWQQPHNLCYCNYLEHLLLHIHINKKRCQENDWFVDDGLVHHIIPAIQDFYKNHTVYTDSKTQWRNVANNLIADNEEDFRDLIDFWLEEIKDYTSIKKM